MSSYQEFLAERDKIDFLLQTGYVIKAVRESLDGAIVEFEQYPLQQATGNNKTETLRISTADARKYFVSLLIKQMNGA